MVRSILQMKKVVRRLKMIETLQIADSGDEIPEEVLTEISEMRLELLNNLQSILDKEERAVS
ncbi:hypothetical protein P3719_23795 [Vibrio parahaemolyticus]|uniref:hypothetical protein n=1 Tax=Vibrio harveyi group TaxID=717610 RepID=UPI0011218C43|nr:hypothetical protein [Vibrio parahaemolyticus]EHR5466263.1 hypothetical protein [Vibrio parahaemolyticus]EKB1992592.1 hypothetical protein [Vibrio parahaemolyticus]EME0136078.1 hypothetical protein [Vibrio parahaemolyticus]MBM5082364.1 hypothetical protein [Vibrio parahaemolyticus]MCA6691565.1 hypothetical protein [Vibrio parahaemolyticus]